MLNRAKTITAEVVDLLEASQHENYIGEPVSQLEHALQSAHFAKKAKCSDEMIIAALLHDIGHLCEYPQKKSMAGLGVYEHERIGAEFLKQRHFSSMVCELVVGHVQAKRYLVFKEFGYGKKLSEASQGTLHFQGGPMNKNEADAFEKDPLFREKIMIRKFDELAKETYLERDSLPVYTEMIHKHLLPQLTQS